MGKIYCEKSYGVAAPAMERYHMFMEDNWEKNGLHVAYWCKPLTVSMTEFFPSDMMVRADRLLREAEAVNADSLSKERIKLIRADFDYLRLVLNYLDSISKPFQGISVGLDPIWYEGGDIEWKSAVREAASIGEVLAPMIWKFFKEHYPETLEYDSWVWKGVERLLQTHNNPIIIPGAQRTY